MNRYATYNKGGISRPLMHIPDLSIILRPKVTAPKEMTSQEKRQHALKMEPLIRELRAEGLSWDKIAARTGLSSQRLRVQFPDNKGGNWAKSEEVKKLYPKIKEMLSKGHKQSYICEQLKLSRNTFQRHVKIIKEQDAKFRA